MREFEEANPFSEGFASVKKHGRWGIITDTGKQLTPFCFDEAGNYHNGFCKVRYHGKWRFINSEGKLLEIEEALGEPFLGDGFRTEEISESAE